MIEGVNKTVNLNGIVFANGKAEYNGAAISSYDTGYKTININACEFINNTAKSNGGAIYINLGTADINIKDSKFINNTVEDNKYGDGGAITLFTESNPDNLNVVINNTEFINNKAGRTGGAIDNYAKLTIVDSKFIDNKAGDKSNSIYSSSILALENNIINTTYAEIVNDGIISSTVNATVLENKTKDIRASTTSLYAVVCDDSGNLIYDSNLQFTVGDDNITAKPYYDLEYYASYSGFEEASIYVVGMKSTKAGQALDVHAATIRNTVGTFTYAQWYIDACAEYNVETLTLPGDIKYNAVIDGDFKTLTISKNLTVNGNAHDIVGNGTCIVAIAEDANVTLKNISFSNADLAVLSNGNVVLDSNVISSHVLIKSGTASFNNNDISGFIINAGSIISKMYATILDNKTWNDTKLGDITLNATLTDDVGNRIYDSSFRFTVDGYTS